MPVSIILWDEQLKAMVYLYTRLAEWHMLDFAQASLISAYLTPDRFKNIFTHRGPRWSPFLSVDQNSWEFMTGSVVALGGVLYIYIYNTSVEILSVLYTESFDDFKMIRQSLNHLPRSYTQSSHFSTLLSSRKFDFSITESRPESTDQFATIFRHRPGKPPEFSSQYFNQNTRICLTQIY